ncbi:LamG domain-containing protein [Micromonospora sp. HSS6-12]|uniref:LamG domain-containing protein n=2 Tax=Micromonospora thermarum TaxID=2720024 RepID=A0ABX0ZH37_9ACTN|nr:LamG domain-containing protein [Micromonospora thermarum]
MVGGVAPASASAPAGCVSAVADEAEAVRLAMECGQRVEVLSARTPWVTTTAEPTGELTWKAATLAERTNVGGQWRSVDPTITAGTGPLSPTAPVLPMRFSPGGDGPLARIEHEGRALELSSPVGSLPAPSVSGRTLVYESVLPDVDLRVSVDDDGTGFSEVLVVHTPEAAANPALEQLSFPLRTEGGLSVMEVDGGLSVVDGAGVEVFTSPTPLMWDSSGGVDASTASLGSFGTLGFDDEPVLVEREVSPAPEDQVAEMPAEFDGRSVTITPDQGMLTSPETVWPVFIDPTFDAGHGVTRNEWTMIAEAWPTQSYHNFSGSNGVGLCSTSYDSDCVRTGRKRLVWEFNIPSSIHGSVVSSASFSAYKTTAYSCNQPGWVRLYRVNSISSSTTWSSHHAHWDDGGTAPSIDSQAPNGQCTGWEEWNATAGAQSAADNNWDVLTMGLRAMNEGNMPDYWRQFRNDASLSITFNRYPNIPTNVSLDPSTTVGSGPSGFITRDATPQLFATVSDPDRNFGQTVQGVFQIWWGSTKVWEGQSALVLGVSNVSPQTAPPALVEDRLYTVRVWAKDAAGLMSKQWSDFIQFTVDVTPPAVPPVVVPQEVATGITAKYVENAWAGGPGQAGAFAFKPNGVTDVNRYQYSFDSSTYTGEVGAAANGDSASLISYTPSSPGMHTLRVWTVDKAGWIVDEPEEYQFWVHTAPKAAWWMLDGDGTDSAIDGANPLTVTGTASWPAGALAGVYPTDKALHLDGATTGAATAGPVVQTTGSYTVTAFVKTGGSGGSGVAVSQDGVYASGFRLGITDKDCPTELGSRCWALSLANIDRAVPEPGWTVLRPDPLLKANPQYFAIKPDTWTHLAGVYDAGAGKLRLYVNGVAAGEMSFTATWDAVGRLRIGHANDGTSAVQRWSGDMDDVRVYRVALDDNTIGRISQGSRGTADIPQ